MKDFVGQELGLNDQVAFTAPQYRHLCKGTIIAFTKTKVRIQYTNTWNYGKPGLVCEYLSEPNFLIKVFV
jgi:hypothetical protein